MLHNIYITKYDENLTWQTEIVKVEYDFWNTTLRGPEDASKIPWEIYEIAAVEGMLKNLKPYIKIERELKYMEVRE